MKPNTLLFLLIGITISLQSIAQDFKKEFETLNASNDTAGQSSLLKEWETIAPNDPELFVSYYNYYYQKSKSDYIGLEKIQRGETSIELKDSSGNIAGYMNSVVTYDSGYLKKAFDYIDRGIADHPNRLDMRFGKIYLLGELEDYRNFTDEIIKTIEYSKTNKNAWLWSDNKPQSDGKEFMLSSMQNYVIQLYNTYDDALLENMKQISQTVLKFYPDHVESLSNLAIVYILEKDYDKALDALLRAEKIAPKDHIVLGNIAQAYERKGDIANALKYYELTKKYGDDEAKEIAKEHIAELKMK